MLAGIVKRMCVYLALMNVNVARGRFLSQPSVALKISLKTNPPIRYNLTLTYNQLSQSEVTYQLNNCKDCTAEAISSDAFVLIVMLFFRCVRMYLVLLSASLLIIFENIVSDVVLWVNEELLGLTLLIPPLHPHHKQQHKHYRMREDKAAV